MATKIADQVQSEEATQTATNEALLQEYASLLAQAELVDPIYARMAEIEDHMRGLDTHTHVFDDATVRVSSYSRWNYGRAEELLTEKQLKKVTVTYEVTEIDRDLMEEHFPKKFEQAKVAGKNRVEIRVTERAMERARRKAARDARATIRVSAETAGL